MDKQILAQLRSKRFALDEIVPLVESAADVIERLQSEIAVMVRELRAQPPAPVADQAAQLEASRYRYLRDVADPAWVARNIGLPPHLLDAAIDAAMKNPN
ncbi:MAG TPA: hypothetical protein VGU61_10895 [Noviherbaspirillum sp.]|jgi:hypothetical protein|uniref:hypothetical protein n=1 Tax=Noviherbaspirillum sp. TaxID=1926288 RepID=UPI002DDD2453|nr:hypothetical protein [Noviherbaspirillum sp.]HEV2610763.1 hypothetical protein [Noviherbaspirillum sp.]